MRLAAALAAGLALSPAAASAWLAEGHRLVAAAAVRSLPEEVPADFRAAAGEIGGLALVPDLAKGPGTPALRDGESPEHYLDVERLEGEPWPELRSSYLAELGRRGLPVTSTGTLPYAIREQTERLALAFALLRRHPGEAGARSLASVAAGALAHYGADLEQPLHTTIHHDGWALADGRTPHVGVHRQVDALLERAPYDREVTLAAASPRVFEDLDAAIRGALAESHAELDRTYWLAPALATPDGYSRPEVVVFACERYAAAVRFVGSLMRTAWERSRELPLPPD